MVNVRGQIWTEKLMSNRRKWSKTFGDKDAIGYFRTQSTYRESEEDVLSGVANSLQLVVSHIRTVLFLACKQRLWRLWNTRKFRCSCPQDLQIVVCWKFTRFLSLDQFIFQDKIFRTRGQQTNEISQKCMDELQGWNLLTLSSLGIFCSMMERDDPK